MEVALCFWVEEVMCDQGKVAMRPRSRPRMQPGRISAREGGGSQHEDGVYYGKEEESYQALVEV